MSGLHRKDQDVRIFDHLNIGPTRLRGFEANGIGPVDDAGNRLGGTTYLNATAEAQFAFPALPRNLGFKGAVFADAATLFGSDLTDATDESTDMNWRASAGVSLIWNSPFAPLRIDYAFPIVIVDFTTNMLRQPSKIGLCLINFVERGIRLEQN